MSDAGPPGTHSAEQALFADILSCEPCLPARFVPMPEALMQPRRRLVEAERLLLRLAQIEDGQGAEDAEDHGHQDLALQRIEARLHLLSEQVAALLRQAREPLPEQVLHWSSRGVSLTHPQAVDAGDTGLVEIEVAEWLPQPLRLPAVAIATHAEHERHRLWLRFDPGSEGARRALERHLFRLHRREVAEARRQQR